MGKKKEPFTFKIIDNDITVFSEKPKTDWCKAVMKVSWGDKPASLDIRNIKLSNDSEEPFLGKGISISDEDVDKLTDILISRGYGSTNVIEQELLKRKKMFEGFTLDKNTIDVEPIEVK